MKSYYVYMLASRPGGARYVGVTNDLVRRLHEHRLRRSGHTKQYNISQLVWFEMHQTAIGAIQREKEYEALAARVENAAHRRGQSELAGLVRGYRLVCAH